MGAARSGKSFLDYSVLVPRRILDCPADGMIALVGHTRYSLERNLLEPMRGLWGESQVGRIRSADGTVVLFGRRCHVFGAGNIGQVAKLQGTSMAYCYGDEVATWKQEVFEMLKSRMDRPHSCFDGTSNPDTPGHWLKKFLDSDTDIYQQHYEIGDNPYIAPEFVAHLKAEYRGTVYYDRYILGRWTAAEGVIYRQFADEPERYRVRTDAEYLKDVDFVTIGVDFGGTRSLTAFVATAVHRGFAKLTALGEHHIPGRKGDIDADRLCGEFVGFVQRLRERYPTLWIRYVYADSEAQYLINSLRKACRLNGLDIPVRDSAKRPVRERIIAANTLLNTGRMRIGEQCQRLAEGLRSAVWDAAKPDTRRDDFTSDIDILDAFEYSWERFIGRLSIPGMRAYGR